MPKDDLSPRSGVIIPASYRVVGPDAEHPGAQEVLASAATTINRFIAHQRQLASLSLIEQHRAQLDTPDVDIEYHSNQGEERITLRPYVTEGRVLAEEPGEELQTDVVAPVPYGQDDLYLLVLYKSSRYAAFPMSSLGVSSKTGKAVATLFRAGNLDRPGNPVDFGTDPIYVNQLTLAAGRSFILSGADMTGHKGQGPKSPLSMGDKLYLSTPLLLDTIETTLPNTWLPFMNGRATGKTQYALYLSKESYTYDTKTLFALNTSIPDAQVKPYALDTDGTSYYYTYYTGPATLKTVNADETLYDDYQPKYNALLDELQETATPTAGGYYTYDIKSHDYKYEPTLGPNGGLQQTDQYYNDHETKTAYVGGAQTSTTPTPVSDVAAIGYYGFGAYGQKPTAMMTMAIAPQLYTQYDPNQNATLLKPGMKFVPDYSGMIPLTVYDLKQHTIAPMLLNVTATATIKHTLTQIGDIIRNPRGPDYIADTIYEQMKNGNQLDGTQPYSESSEEEVAQVWQVGNSPATMAMASTTDAKTLMSLGQQMLTIVGMTVEFYKADNVQHVHYDNNTGDTTTTGGLVVTDPNPINYVPGVVNQTDKKVNSGTLTFEQDSITDPSAILVLPFPPALSATPPHATGSDKTYYSISGTGTVTSVTPYKRHSVAILPWLHLANEQHYIQGYTTDDNHFLYLDGGDLMAFLTGVLSCEDTDVVAAYMDVPLIALDTLDTITSKVSTEPPQGNETA